MSWITDPASRLVLTVCGFRCDERRKGGKGTEDEKYKEHIEVVTLNAAVILTIYIGVIASQSLSVSLSSSYYCAFTITRHFSNAVLTLSDYNG